MRTENDDAFDKGVIRGFMAVWREKRDDFLISRYKAGVPISIIAEGARLSERQVKIIVSKAVSEVYGK